MAAGSAGGAGPTRMAEGCDRIDVPVVEMCGCYLSFSIYDCMHSSQLIILDRMMLQ